MRKSKDGKKGGREEKQVVVMFIPMTEGSGLKKDLQELEERSNFTEKVRYVETVGPSVASSLVKQDPWMEACGRPGCWTCQEQPGSCMKKGLVYLIDCKTCHEEGKKTLYIGETARSSFDRGNEHLVAIKKMNNESPLVEHQLNNHPDTDPKFGMKIEGFYRGPLQRQTREGQLISEYCKGPLMNR